MFQLVLKIYELRHQGNGYMLPEIKRFLEKKKYNEVRTKVAKNFLKCGLIYLYRL